MTPHVTRAVAEGAASTRTMPSREFMTQQAVLNASLSAWPWCVGRERVLFLQGYTDFGRYVTRYFHEAILNEYRAIANRFQSAQIISEIFTVGSSRL